MDFDRKVSISEAAPEVELYEVEEDCSLHRPFRATRRGLPDAGQPRPSWNSDRVTAIARAAVLDEVVNLDAQPEYAVEWTDREAVVYMAPASHEVAFDENDLVITPPAIHLENMHALSALSRIWDEVHHHPVDNVTDVMRDAATLVEAPVHFNIEDFRIGSTTVDVRSRMAARTPSLARPPTRPRSPRAAPAWRSGGGDASAVPTPLVTSWLIDSGCPLDLIDSADAAPCRSYVVKGPLVTLATANGDTDSRRVLPLQLQRLGESIRPYVLDETPNVLSLGRRVVEDGYDFAWDAHSMSPKLTKPHTGEVIQLTVKDFVPYLDVGNGDAIPQRSTPAMPGSSSSSSSTGATAGSSGQAAASSNASGEAASDSTAKAVVEVVASSGRRGSLPLSRWHIHRAGTTAACWVYFVFGVPCDAGRS